MKLSEMTTDKMLDVIADITPSIGEIVCNENIRQAFKDKVKASADDTAETLRAKGFTQGIRNICKVVPLVLKENRRDCYIILSAFNDVPVKELEQQSPLKTIKQLTELVTDKELMELFTSLTLTEVEG